ncbi:hypothetical protein WMY93_008256 [Mugilogobius chulae]|uniref:Cadherin domain-containing protein n=1 Tax=Mugilogobius chulae TaxID=88201 RepID=A0AAW0PFH6_9GOBI
MGRLVSLDRNYLTLGVSFSFQVTATDEDRGSFGAITYILGSPGGGAVPTQFTIHKETGQICTSTTLDRDDGLDKFDLTVTATDGGGLSSVAQVRVTVVDINDNRPTFYPVQYTVSLSTHSAPGTSVAKVTANDPDSGPNGRVTYRTAPGGGSAFFTLNKDTDGGGLKAPADARVNISIVGGSVASPFFRHNPHRSALDHEICSSLELEIQARYGSPPAYGTTRVRITISDMNDNAPVFYPSSSESLLLPEITKMGSVIYRIQASDKDSGHNGQLSFDLVSAGASGSNGQRTFGVDRGSGEVRLIGSLSYETVPRYDLQIVAKDGGAPQLSSTFTLVVHIQAQDAQGPHFDTLTYRVELRENSPLNTRFLQVRALNRESSGNGGASSSSVSYRLRPDGDAAGFGIMPDSGWLFVRSSLDREVKDMYLLTVLATSAGQGGTGRTGSATVRVTVTDENDNAPRLSQERVFLAVGENLMAGTGFGRVSATDRDAGLNARLTYRLLHPDKHFQINAQTGEISTRLALDREQQSSYQLVVVVQDGGTPPRSATGTAHVTVLDENDHTPMFTHVRPDRELLLQVNEGLPSGSVITTLTAKDPDEGENGTLFYSLSGPQFIQIQPQNQCPVHDAEHRRGGHTGLCDWLVRSRDQYNSVEGQVTYLVVGGTDRDGTFMVDRLRGDVYLVRELDYEKGSRYTLQVEVSDFSQAYPSSHLVQLDIYVQDNNDHAPHFTQDPISIVVQENTEPGAFVHTFQAIDQDGSGPNSELRYSIEHQWPDTADLLTLDPVSGVLTLGQKLDRETTPSLYLVVRATDQAVDPSQRRWGSVTARIFVRDENDNAPVFSSPSAVSVMEDQPVGFVILYVIARDDDEGENGRVSYRIQTGNSAGRFSLNPNTGSLSILKALDREEHEVYNLTIVAEDHGIPQLSTSQVLSVQVIDAKATDKDEAFNGKVLYFLSKEAYGAFTIDENTGHIITSAPLDREKVATYTFQVLAVDLSPAEPRNNSAQVIVTITDVNDNAPFFLQDPLIIETSSKRSQRVLATMKAEDKDFGANGSVFYRFATPVRGFSINSLTGEIQATEPLTGLTQAQRTLIVEAMDQGSPAQSAQGVVVIFVKEVQYSGIRFSRNARDVNIQENAAKGTAVFQAVAQHPDGSNRGISYSLFSGNRKQSFIISSSSGRQRQPARFQLQNYVAYLREAHGYDQPIIQVVAEDMDQGSNGQVTYSFQSPGQNVGLFKIDPTTGTITTAAIMDREIFNQTKLVVTATDRGSPQLAGSATLTVIIVDQNDNSPTIPLPQEIRIPENTLIGTEITLVTGNDVDSSPALSYSLRLEPAAMGRFGIHRFSGSVSLTAPLDFEEKTWYTLTVRASDSRHDTEANITILVEDINDNTPTFTNDLYQVTLPEHTPAGSAVVTVTATDRDSGDNGRITYRVMSSTQEGFYIDPNNEQCSVPGGAGLPDCRTLLLAEGLDFEMRPLYNLTVVVSDRGVPQRSSSVAAVITIGDVNDNPPVFSRADYTVALSEGAAAGTEIIRLTATDLDSTPNAQIQYTISSGDEVTFFLWINGPGLYDFSEHSIGNISLLILSLSKRQTDRVLTASIRENQPANSAVTVLHAIDHDTGVYGHLKYFMIERASVGKDSFIVDQNTGEIRSKMSFDFEKINSFNFVAFAVDSGNHSATVTVQVFVTGEDEYDPLFTSPEFAFEVPEGAKKGQSIGQVQANDEDGGVDGIVLYSLPTSSPYFDVNKTTGVIFLKLDSTGSSSSNSGSGRSKREARLMNLDVKAHSPLDSSRTTTAQISIDVTNTNFGLAPDVNILLISIIAVSLGFIVLLVIMAVIVYLVKSRRRKKGQDTGNRNVASGTAMQKLDECSSGPGERIYHQTLPGYATDQGVAGGGPYPRGGSLDPSHSSGRGSAEAAEDDEIRMINEYPRVASITSSMQEHISARGPDSGIQQDADQLSDISCEPSSLEGSSWFKGKKLGGSLSGTLLSGQMPVYRDEGGGYLGVGRGLNISLPKDYAFPEDGKPSVDGSLTAIVASDEELRGSYNWDYLLNWCPQFQPLANVFTEIARLKDETAQQTQNPRPPFQPKHKIDTKSRIDPPPLITSVAHPGAMSVPPKVPPLYDGLPSVMRVNIISSNVPKLLPILIPFGCQIPSCFTIRGQPRAIGIYDQHQGALTGPESRP